MRRRPLIILAAVAAIGLYVVIARVLRHRTEKRKELSRSLLAAAQADDASKVRHLLERGADPSFMASSTNCPPHSPIRYAIDNDNREMLRLLLERGAEVNERAFGWTALHAAARNGKTEAVRCLLEHGAEVNALAFGDTALHEAAENGKTEVVRCLLEHGAEVDLRSRRPHGATPLLLAAALQTRRSELLRLLLEAGADPNARAGGGCSPFMLAAERPCREACDLMRRYGAEYTINEAAALGNLEDVRSFLAKDPGCKDRETYRDKTPIYSAAIHGHADVFFFLLEKGADIKARCDPDKTTVLHAAVHGGRLDIVKALLERGIPADAPSEDKETPLHCTPYENRLEIARLLIANGADVNATTRRSGRAPIHGAAYHHRTDIVSLLLEHGADPNHRTSGKGTPLHSAVFGTGRVTPKDIETVKLLLDRGAKKDVRDRNGKTPKDIATRFGKEELVLLLQ